MAKVVSDYTQLIPPPPEDLVEEILRQGAFKNTDRIIFSAEYAYIPLIGKKEKMAKCVCTACHDEWYEMWVNDKTGCGRYGNPYGIETQHEKVYSGNTMLCPQCGQLVTLTHISDVDPNSRHNKSAWISVFGRIGSAFTVTDYCIIQKFSKEGQKNYDVEKYSAYVFENDKKCIQLQGFKKNFNIIRFENNWWQKSRCDGNIEDSTSYIYPYPKDFMHGTTMENSRLDKYLDTAYDEHNKLYPVKYLRLYQKRHSIETIMDIGLEYMVRGELSNLSGSYYSKGVSEAFNGADWKQKSPYKILGYDRREMKIIKSAELKWDFINRYKELKKAGVAFIPQNINLVRKYDFYTVSKIQSRDMPVIKTLNYLSKQGKTYYFLEDYWNMAERFGLDLNNPLVRYPKQLHNKHDELVQKIKWQESKALQEKFRKLAEQLDIQQYSDGEICIRAAQNETELIKEGKILCHCVGGYGKQHCNGNSIFFVRKADKPDTPWYTLQVDLKKGTQMQLHGYNNDRDAPIPQEVHDFVDYWLKNVFRPFDVQTMKFIDKSKAAAIPTATA